MKSFAAAALASFAFAADKAIVGTNIGGWQVLEPWITPSLFYRFLDKTHSEGVGADQYTFCEALGPEEGNRVLKAHWDSWITDETLEDLAKREVEWIRVPIGDWTINQYGPYVGCTDGAKEAIGWLLERADFWGLKVWLDLHAIKGSQNGYDNSGLSNKTVWLDETHYEHWDHQSANWMGEWDEDSMTYTTVVTQNVVDTLDQVTEIIKYFAPYPAFMGFEPVNEPLGGTDLGLLKWYYQNVRQVLRTYREDAIFIFHESYHFDAETWNSLFSDEDMDNVVLDTHQYICFGAKFEEDIMTHCDNYKESLKPAKDIKYPVWVGEWSLATDTCAHWLNGFNDHRDDYAYECQMVDCPYSYLSGDLAVDFDRTADILGPFGGSTTLGAIQKGKCYNDSAYFSDEEVNKLAKCMLDAFDEYVDGQFLWTAHNEIETKWDYIRAYDQGFLNQDNTMSNFSGIFSQ